MTPTELVGCTMSSADLETSIEFRIMPNGNGRWYWEVITGGRKVVTRGVAETEPAACQEAGDAARKAKLIQ
jgi:hypothetical protein